MGLILALILFFYNHGYQTTNRFLAAFFFLIAVFSLSQYAVVFNQSLSITALFASGPAPFVFLIGPFSYFYVRSVLRDNARIVKYDYLHFLFFAIEFAGMIPYYISSWDHKISVARVIQSNDWHIAHLNLNSLFISPINSYLRPLHIIVYVIAQWVLIINYYRNSRNISSSSAPFAQKQLIKRWLLILTSVFTLFLLCYCIISLNILLYKSRAEFLVKSEPFIVAGIFFIVLLNIFTLLFPQILYGLPKLVSIPNSHQPKDFDKQEQLTEKLQEAVMKNASPELPNKNILLITEKLQLLYQESQPWTDKNFSIATLAISLNVPEHHLRYYFNHHLMISFPTYKNRLRVDHVKSIIEDGAHKHLSLEGIGRMAGFTSKSGFFSGFKNETGVSPLEYQEQVQQK